MQHALGTPHYHPNDWTVCAGQTATPASLQVVVTLLQQAVLADTTQHFPDNVLIMTIIAGHSPTAYAPYRVTEDSSTALTNTTPDRVKVWYAT